MKVTKLYFKFSEPAFTVIGCSFSGTVNLAQKGMTGELRPDLGGVLVSNGKGTSFLIPHSSYAGAEVEAGPAAGAREDAEAHDAQPANPPPSPPCVRTPGCPKPGGHAGYCPKPKPEAKA